MGDHYDIIGGAICGLFVVGGVVGVLCYRPWRTWVEKGRPVGERVDDDEEDPDLKKPTIGTMDSREEELALGQSVSGVERADSLNREEGVQRIEVRPAGKGLDADRA